MSTKIENTKGLDYNIFRMGYIIAYKSSKTLFDRAIVAKQRFAGFPERAAAITHVEISGGGVHSINIAPPFSKLVNISTEHAGRYAYLLRYKNQDYEDRGRYKVAYFSATLCNKGYDIAGILNFLHKWIGQNNRLWFCSEGCLWALQKVYPEILDYLKPAECMPADFLNEDKNFEVVWEGLIPKIRR